MKVVIINYSGNVGKSTIATNLLASRMNSPRKFEVESFNAGGDAEAQKIVGARFGELIDAVMESDDVIVDVGASNVGDFMKLMQRYAGSHEEFDYFIVPVVKERKQQADTLATLSSLQQIGIPSSKVRVVFNKIDLDDEMEKDFAAIYGMHSAEKNFVLRPNALIYENEVYERLSDSGKSLSDVISDSTDYRAKLKTLTDESERGDCLQMIAMKRLGVTATKNLDDTFQALFP